MNLDFHATGRFVHTALTDQTLNTNIYGLAWLFNFFITVVVGVVIVVVYTVLLFMWFMFFCFCFYPVQKKK